MIAALASLATSDATSVWTRTAVMSSIAGHSLAFLGELRKTGLFHGRCGQAWLDDLAFLVGSERDPVQACRLLDRAVRCQAGLAILDGAHCALGRGRQRAGGSIRQVLEGNQSETDGVALGRCGSASPASDGGCKTVWWRSGCSGWRSKDCSRFVSRLLDARQPTAVQLGVLQSIAGILDGDLARQIVMPLEVR